MNEERVSRPVPEALYLLRLQLDRHLPGGRSCGLRLPYLLSRDHGPDRRLRRTA